jgi:membrane fusion protein, copper/silver efflux system
VTRVWLAGICAAGAAVVGVLLAAGVREGRPEDASAPVHHVHGRTSEATDQPVQIGPERRQLIGVRLGRVEQSRATATIRALGRVALDETRVFPVIAGSDGWVMGIAPGSTTGSTVRKGQPLVSIYGREYVTAQRSFLYALQSVEHPAPGPTDAQAQSVLNVTEARFVLLNLGFGPDQIQQLVQTREVLPEIMLTAPASGVLLARNVFQNQRFERGVLLFRIADLHHVWVVADLSRDDEASVRSGDIAMLTISTQPPVHLQAKVAAVLPPFDASSRTFKVRLETDNPHLILRPDMVVDLEFPLALAEAITVPAEAVIESGHGTTVFVDLGGGRFVPRAVETGARLGDRVQIVRGLTAGESIAVSGAFLLDSETRMRSASPGGHD